MLPTLDMGKKTFVFREVGDQAFQSAAHHGVLAHQDDGTAAERLSDLVHLSYVSKYTASRFERTDLLRGDIVDADEED